MEIKYPEFDESDGEGDRTPQERGGVSEEPGDSNMRGRGENQGRKAISAQSSHQGAW